MTDNRKIRTALLAYGMSGKVFHAPFLELHPGFELVGTWERSGKKVRNDYPTAKSYSSLEQVLDDDIDLVIINTPTATHFEYAKAALLAGKHVLVEKAFTSTVAEAEELCNLAEARNLKLAVFHNRRYDSDFLTVRDVFEKDILGEIVEAEIHFDRYNPRLSPKQHKETASPGSGILKDLGSHIIDQAICLFGFPIGLFADIRITRQNSVVDDWFDITLHYEQHRVRLKAGFFVREPLPSYILHGMKGSFLKSRGDVQEDELKTGNKPVIIDWGIEPVNKSGLLHTEIEGQTIRENVPTKRGNYYWFFDSLFRAIYDDGPVPVSAEDGIKVMKIIEAAIQSSNQKQYIQL